MVSIIVFSFFGVPTLHVLAESCYILDVVVTFGVWIINKHATDHCLSGSTRAFVWLCHLCDPLTISVRDKPAAWLVSVMYWKSSRGAAGVPPNSSLMLFQKVSFRMTTPAPVIVRATLSWPIYLLFLFSPFGNCLKNLATDIFYSFPMIRGDATKSV